MYELTVTASLAAAHHLRGYQGKCEKVHGHNYRVEATVAASSLDKTGLAMDFHDLKRHLKAVVERFDHTDLNEAAEFQAINPSCEILSRVLYQDLARALQGTEVRVLRVRVWETDTSCVTYHEEST